MEKKEEILPSYLEYLDYMKSVNMPPVTESVFNMFTKSGYNMITKQRIRDPEED